MVVVQVETPLMGKAGGLLLLSTDVLEQLLSVILKRSRDQLRSLSTGERQILYLFSNVA